MINLIKSKYQPIGQFGLTPAQKASMFNESAISGPASGQFVPNNNTEFFQSGLTPTVAGATPPNLNPNQFLDTVNLQSTAFSGKTFSRFTVDDMVKQQTELVTGGVWSTGLGSLITHFSSSAQTTTQRRYYVDIQNSLPTATDSLVQYSIAYGHAYGSGSDSQGQLSDSPARAIYSQFKQLLLNTSEARFTTQGSGSTDSIYAITFKRNRMKERLDPGNFEIPLTTITSRAVNATGSVVVGSSVFTLIDDSSINTTPVVGAMGRVYNIVSGSISTGVFGGSAAPVYYGKAFPDYGVVILDGNVLDQKLAFKTQLSSSVECNNHFALFRSISGSGLVTNPSTSDKYGFLARNSEKITSAHYFVRVRNNEFNFSNNPSYVTGSTGDIKEVSFKKDPITYITTVGLYNDSFELLAVAKVSKPILKSFSRESLIRVKLDF
jgi:hypothetical protein